MRCELTNTVSILLTFVYEWPTAYGIIVTPFVKFFHDCSLLFVLLLIFYGLHPAYHPAPILCKCHYYYGIIEDSFCASAVM